MKILCPTIFFPPLANAVKYAANLAQEMNATLTLLYIQNLQRGDGVSLFAGEEPESFREAGPSLKLELIARDISNEYKISCDYEISNSILPLSKTIADEAAGFDLIVIGSSGADSIYRHYFGTNSLNIAKRTDTPIIIVPWDCTCKPIRRIVFASDYSTGDPLSLDQLKQFIELVYPELYVLHVSEKDTPSSMETYKLFSSLVSDKLNYHSTVFNRKINWDKQEAIDSYVKVMDADLLTVCLGHGFLYQLLHAKILKELTDNPSIPILVTHN